MALPYGLVDHGVIQIDADKVARRCCELRSVETTWDRNTHNLNEDIDIGNVSTDTCNR